MEAVQEAVRAGRCTDQQEEEAIEALGGPEAATYGELTPLGFRSMAARLELCAEDSFVDLGSGLGRMVLQAATEYGVRRACGVELAPSRHTLAQEARDRAHESVASRVLLVEGDCAAEDVWHEHLGDATVVFASNLCALEAKHHERGRARCTHLLRSVLSRGCVLRAESAGSSATSCRSALRSAASPATRCAWSRASSRLIVVWSATRRRRRPSCARRVGGYAVSRAPMLGAHWACTPLTRVHGPRAQAPEELQQAGALDQAGSLVYIYRRVSQL
jgi:hypothetical protein